MGIEVISELIPKNQAKFALADVNHLRGGYIQVETMDEMQAFLLYRDRLKEGMLCFVRKSPTSDHMYLLKDNEWIIWSGQGGSGGGGGGFNITIVTSLEELQSLPDLEVKGQIVFVDDIRDLRYFNGDFWESFSRIYIQSIPPEDLGGIWIDTSEDKEHLESSTVILNLLKVIDILQLKVNKMEYAFNNTMNFGDFENNNYHAFNDAKGIEPYYGTSEEEDLNLQELNKHLALADSPEPVEYKDFKANCRHLQIKSGTEMNMQNNKNDFAPSELLYCFDTKTLWIKDPKTLNLVQIGKVGGSVNPDIPEIMEGIIEQGKNIAGIKFVDMVNPDKSYLFEVRNGELNLYDQDLDTKNLPDTNTLISNGSDNYITAYEPKPSESDPSKVNPRFYLNMIYCGSDNDKNSYSPCDYNFVELSNNTNYDINLKGLYLHYTEGVAEPSGERYWLTLPLEGTIKSKHTFLIRGAQCGNKKFARVNVGKPDMYWTKHATVQNNLLDNDEHSVWDNDGYIKFNKTSSFYLSGEPKEGTYAEPSYPLYVKNPYIMSKAYEGVIYGYIDLVGFGQDSSGMNMPGEGTVMSEATTDRIMMKYFSMDDMSQAYKGMNKRSNASDWTFIDLVNTNQEIDLTDYIPKNSTQNKDIFFNKHLLSGTKPCFVNVTFGYNAHKTRCFTWVTKGYRDEFLQYKKEGDTEWITVESFKEGDGRDSKGRNWDNKIYNRIRSFTTDGTYFTSHKCMIDLPPCESELKYIYRVGYENNWTDERSFILRNQDQVASKGFNFLHVTDQQGFNQEEYKTWELSAEFIEQKDPEKYDFMINTGDGTLSGNRVNEWVDYFNGGNCLTNHLEQMFVVGNNDLCPVDSHVLGDGRDLAKHNSINMEYFFTYEYPYEVPTSTDGTYISSMFSFVYGNTYFLGINSEITSTAIENIYHETEKNIYSDIMKTWCEQLLQHVNSDFPAIKWKIALCHESPFTIITDATIEGYIHKTEESTNQRGGSKLNTLGNYFFSKFLLDNGFNLCLCGHKHTYANSRYLREPSNVDGNTFAIDIYDPLGEQAEWYQQLNTGETDYRVLVNISDDLGSLEQPKHYVKYVMCLATGFKLVSNKELPGRHLPFLQEYYKCNEALKVNPNQQYPHYIIWNVGEGPETETDYLYNFKENKVDTPEEPILQEARPRILGHAKKLWNKKKGSVSASTKWSYKYNAPLTIDDVDYYGGNGESSNNGSNNIIVEKLI